MNIFVLTRIFSPFKENQPAFISKENVLYDKMGL